MFWQIFTHNIIRYFLIPLATLFHYSPQDAVKPKHLGHHPTVGQEEEPSLPWEVKHDDELQWPRRWKKWTSSPSFGYWRRTGSCWQNFWDFLSVRDIWLRNDGDIWGFSLLDYFALKGREVESFWPSKSPCSAELRDIPCFWRVFDRLRMHGPNGPEILNEAPLVKRKEPATKIVRVLKLERGCFPHWPIEWCFCSLLLFPRLCTADAVEFWGFVVLHLGFYIFKASENLRRLVKPDLAWAQRA